MTELELAADSGLSVLPPARVAPSAVKVTLMEHAEMMQTARQLAGAMCGTQMVPTRFRGKPDDGAAAILYGAELGLNPIQSLQRVVPIHGSPSLEARTMVALLKARGYRFKWVEKSDTRCTFEGWSPDGEDHEVSTWTIEDAKKRGYVPRPASDKSLCRPEVDDDWVTVTKTFDGRSKKSVVGNMKYVTDPKAMLKAKAQAEVCRDLAPDVLLGIAYSREDLESEQWDDEPRRPVRVTAEPMTVEEIVGTPLVESMQSWRDKVKPAQGPESDVAPIVVEEEEPVPNTEPTLREKWLNRLFDLLDEAGCTEPDDRKIVAAKVAHTAPLLSLDNLSDKQLRAAVNQLNNWRETSELSAQITEILNAATIAAETTASTEN
jgi:hypothetical protein